MVCQMDKQMIGLEECGGAVSGRRRQDGVRGATAH